MHEIQTKIFAYINYENFGIFNSVKLFSPFRHTMSLHKYFKPTNTSRNAECVPVAAAIANLTSCEQQEVENAIRNLDEKPSGSTTGCKRKYVKYDERLRCEVAKFALNGNNKAAARKYGIPVTTVRSFVKSYKETVLENDANVSVLPQKKRGRKTLLPEEIDEKVIEMAQSMRLAGAVVNYNILIAIAKALVIANDRTMLAEFGGSIQLGWKWCTSVFKRMKWVNRKCTTSKPLIAPGLIKEVGFTFYKEISEAVQADNIPPELIINIDQTPLPFVLISKYTMNKKGESNVPILGTSDYRQITGTFVITLSGKFLPMQLIYQGTTDRCHPKYNFPEDFHVTHTSNHWANEGTSIDLLNKIILPYVKQTRKDLGLHEDFPWVLICDVFKAQWTDAVKAIVAQSRGKMIPVPNNWTPYFQPLDVSVNKPCKDFLRNEAQTWYSQQIVEQTKSGKLPHQVKVATQLSIVKPLHAKWVTKFYDYIRSKPDIVRNGWSKALITDCINKKFEVDPFKGL